MSFFVWSCAVFSPSVEQHHAVRGGVLEQERSDWNVIVEAVWPMNIRFMGTFPHAQFAIRIYMTKLTFWRVNTKE